MSNMPGGPHKGKVPAQIDLRKEVQAMIHRAIDSTVNYTGEEYEQNKHNWIQITTDRILAAVVQSLPDPIDVKSKYETDDKNGIYVTVNTDDDRKNQHHLDHLRNFAEDQGYNHFYVDYTTYLRELYTVPQNVLQSEHGKQDISKSGFRQENSDTSEDSEPSKVS